MKRTFPGRMRAVRAGFTLVELIVVVGIIALLMSLLIAALPGVTKTARDNATKQYLVGISTACDAYFAIYDGYPGPFGPADVTAGKISGNQNLFIGLAVPVYVSGPYYAVSTGIQPGPNPSAPQVPPVPFASATGWVGVPGTLVNNVQVNNSFNVGDFSGPIDFSPSPPRTHSPAFFAPAEIEVSQPSASAQWDPYGVNGLSGNGVKFPALVDRYPDAMPILYYRRTAGSEGSAAVDTDQVGVPTTINPPNTIATAAAFTSGSPVPYYLADNLAYTSSTGLRSTRGTVYDQTSGGTPNFTEKNLVGLASNRPLKGNMSSVSIIGRGSYILVSAGNDHIYGTNPRTKSVDDIVVVGGN